MDARLEALKTEILRKRRSGKTTVAVQKIGAPAEGISAHLDAFVSALRFKAIGAEWREITGEQARTFLRHILSQSLAYGSEVMPVEVADGFADRFLDTFSSDGRYFTNGILYKRVDAAWWTPISDATFDTGVLCADSSTTGMLWIQEED